MAMSDCFKCWDTPCTCGWDYRHSTRQGLEDRIEMFRLILQYKTDHPDAVFSKLFEEETEDDKDLMVILNEFHKACYEREKANETD